MGKICINKTEKYYCGVAVEQVKDLNKWDFSCFQLILEYKLIYTF